MQEKVPVLTAIHDRRLDVPELDAFTNEPPVEVVPAAATDLEESKRNELPQAPGQPVVVVLPEQHLGAAGQLDGGPGFQATLLEEEPIAPGVSGFQGGEKGQVRLVAVREEPLQHG